MNTTEAAARARVTVATIRHWCRTGVVAATKTAGRWDIDTASLGRRIAIGHLKTRPRTATLNTAARFRNPEATIADWVEAGTTVIVRSTRNGRAQLELPGRPGWKGAVILERITFN